PLLLLGAPRVDSIEQRPQLTHRFEHEGTQLVVPACHTRTKRATEILEVLGEIRDRVRAGHSGTTAHSSCEPEELVWRNGSGTQPEDLAVLEVFPGLLGEVVVDTLCHQPLSRTLRIRSFISRTARSHPVKMECDTIE